MKAVVATLLVSVPTVVVGIYLAMRLGWSRSAPEHNTDKALAKKREPANPRTLDAIAALTKALPDKVLKETDAVFIESIKSYWSAQEQSLIPAALVRPKSTEDVSIAIRILHEHHVKANPTNDDLHFAIRSGGHAPNVGEANVFNGITLDLQDMNFIELSEDKQSVRVGPATRWQDLYGALEEHGLAVVGGRAATPAVAGLALGGGISFLSPRVGLVCDNVLAQELVLADGTAVTCDADSHADLHLALKGGGNNFGVVTAFTLKTFAQGPMWGGYTFSFGAMAARHIDAHHDFLDPATYDLDASCFLAVAYEGRLGLTIPLFCPVYAKPVAKPPCFKDMLAIPRLWSTTKVRSMKSICQEITASSPNGLRQTWSVTTFERNRDLQHLSHELWRAALPKLKHVRGLVWTIVWNPLPPTCTAFGRSNALGVVSDVMLLLTNVNVRWTDPADDALVYEVSAGVIADIEVAAKERKLYHQYKYVNYSGPEQDPLAGYGEEKRSVLRDTARKYDPDGLFQVACPGGRKLP